MLGKSSGWVISQVIIYAAMDESSSEKTVDGSPIGNTPMNSIQDELFADSVAKETMPNLPIAVDMLKIPPVRNSDLELCLDQNPPSNPMVVPIHQGSKSTSGGDGEADRPHPRCNAEVDTEAADDGESPDFSKPKTSILDKEESPGFGKEDNCAALSVTSKVKRMKHERSPSNGSKHKGITIAGKDIKSRIATDERKHTRSNKFSPLKSEPCTCHEGQAKLAREAKKGQEDKAAEHFHCSKCAFNTLFWRSLVRHEATMHKILRPGLKSYKCALCDYIVLQLSEYGRHMHKHLRVREQDKLDPSAKRFVTKELMKCQSVGVLAKRPQSTQNNTFVKHNREKVKATEIGEQMESAKNNDAKIEVTRKQTKSVKGKVNVLDPMKNKKLVRQNDQKDNAADLTKLKTSVRHIDKKVKVPNLRNQIISVKHNDDKVKVTDLRKKTKFGKHDLKVLELGKQKKSVKANKEKIRAKDANKQKKYLEADGSPVKTMAKKESAHSLHAAMTYIPRSKYTTTFEITTEGTVENCVQIITQERQPRMLRNKHGFYKCPKCKFQTTVPHSLRRHRLALHGNPANSSVFRCNLCNLATNDSYDFKRHTRCIKHQDNLKLAKEGKPTLKRISSRSRQGPFRKNSPKTKKSSPNCKSMHVVCFKNGSTSDTKSTSVKSNIGKRKSVSSKTARKVISRKDRPGTANSHSTHMKATSPKRHLKGTTNHAQTGDRKAKTTSSRKSLWKKGASKSRNALHENGSYFGKTNVSMNLGPTYTGSAEKRKTRKQSPCQSVPSISDPKKTLGGLMIMEVKSISTAEHQMMDNELGDNSDLFPGGSSNGCASGMPSIKGNASVLPEFANNALGEIVCLKKEPDEGDEDDIDIDAPYSFPTTAIGQDEHFAFPDPFNLTASKDVPTASLSCAQTSSALTTIIIDEAPSSDQTDLSIMDGSSTTDLLAELANRRALKECKCGASFLSMGLYLLHQSCHHAERHMQCGFCSHNAEDRYDFFCHLYDHDK